MVSSFPDGTVTAGALETLMFLTKHQKAIMEYRASTGNTPFSDELEDRNKAGLHCTKKSAGMSCARCAGFLVPEWCQDL